MAIQIPEAGNFGYDVSLKYTNSGSHDVICGMRLAAGGSKNYNIFGPWFVLFNIPTQTPVNMVIPSISTAGISQGIYDALAIAGVSYTPGTKLSDILDGEGNVIGIMYQANTGSLHEFSPPVQSEKIGELIIGAPGVGAQIIDFNLVI